MEKHNNRTEHNVEHKSRLVSVRQAAAMLDIGKTFFYEHILGKELLTPVYIAGRTLIAVEDIDDLVQRLRGKAD